MVTPAPAAAAVVVMAVTAVIIAMIVATDVSADADRANMNAGADSISHRGRSSEQADGKNACDNTFHKGVPVDWSLLKRRAP